MSFSFLTGISLIRNGNKLNYPFIQCFNSLTNLCDQVIINIDYSDGSDKTLETIAEKVTDLKKTTIVSSKWNMSNTGDGRELAKQINLLLPFVDSEWIIYLQADELIHEKDVQLIREYLKELPPEISQVELYRTYFWKDLDTRAENHEIWLGRIFRQGTHTVGGDGMYLNRNNGEVIRSPFWIYHYSRIGTEEQIDNRIKTLDRLFHDEETVQHFSTFSFNQSVRTVPFTGTHPHDVVQFFNNRS